MGNEQRIPNSHPAPQNVVGPVNSLTKQKRMEMHDEELLLLKRIDKPGQ
jgi:hypothetical protein